MSRSLDPASVSGTVVVGVDGSEHADRAARWAAVQAACENRPLVVVSAGDQATEQVARAVEIVRATHPDLAVTGSPVDGDAREVLIDASAGAHLLVVGSRGRGTVRSLLLGSVSGTVSAQAGCPVVVCRPPSEDPTHAGVVVGADGTSESVPVLEFAFRHAALHRLPLTVLHSFWDAAAAVGQYREARGLPTEGPELDDLRATLSESIAGLTERYPDVPVTLTLKHGFADEALTPRHGGWDMIVVGRHPMTSLARILTGSVATAVVERARATVAVVPVPPA